MLNFVITVLGLIAVLGVLGIWVAWSQGIFYGVLGAIAVSLCAIVAIGYLAPRRRRHS